MCPFGARTGMRVTFWGKVAEQQTTEKNGALVSEKEDRVYRGGGFVFLPWMVRSAARFWNLPGTLVILNGIRPARTFLDAID